MKGELINITRAWNKEKIWDPDRNPTHDLPNTGQVLHSLSYENSWRARSFNWVHMWQVSCILLGSALSKSTIARPILGWVLCFNRCTLTYTRIIQNIDLGPQTSSRSLFYRKVLWTWFTWITSWTGLWNSLRILSTGHLSLVHTS